MKYFKNKRFYVFMSAASVWFIAAPANSTKRETVQKLTDKMSAQVNGQELAEIFPFQLPDFKV
jgi:hypothetical protein